ncbi:BQ5605_C009g05742 [Microbotryum silenes-dioicae]|uniref:BQ5605_C009g05742 protein n=1 Tax=Microbotryum silenes-dioicae TaxID=796604 RepID=A0A2X0MIL0_9BASI|nr:BQ5605_C009g05742 [Microbotryum silenes-dioicae]
MAEADRFLESVSRAYGAPPTLESRLDPPSDRRHSSSRRSRSPHDDSSSRRSSHRRDDEPHSSSSSRRRERDLYEPPSAEYDRHRSDRDRDRDRDRDHRSDRDRDHHHRDGRDGRRDSERDRDYHRDSRPRYDDYENHRRGDRDDRRRGPPPPSRRYDDDRRGAYGGGGGRRDDDRGNGGGGRPTNRGGRVFEGFASPGRRSPTPEHVQPISKRVRGKSGWDIKPQGFENYTAEQAKMTGLFNLPGQNRPPMPFNPNGPPGPMAGPMGGNMPPLHFRPGGGMPQIPGPIGSFARQSRRLYVGNVTLEATDEAIAHFLNTKMAENNLLSDGHLGEDLAGMNIKGDQPVISVHLNYEKNYAFVEMRNAEEATAALQFDGIIFQNCALKIRRPKDYQGALDATAEPPPHVPGVVSTMVPDTPNKIFIGGLPSYLNDDQVMELLKSFGELRAFNLVKEAGTGQSKGFAFCEYLDPSITEVACQGLNGMELGDRFLVVQRAAIGQRHGPPGFIPGGPHGGPGTGSNQFAPGLGIGPGPNATPSILLAAQSSEVNPTKALQILNMVAPDELTNDQDYTEIIEDVRDECAKFGTVHQVRIPRPIITSTGRVDVKASEAVKDLGKVFVLFDAKEQTTEAMKAIAGRQFGGRVCICAYADEEIFLED